MEARRLDLALFAGGVGGAGGDAPCAALCARGSGG